MKGRPILLLILFAASLPCLGCGRHAGNVQPLPPEPSEVIVPDTAPERLPHQNATPPKR